MKQHYIESDGDQYPLLNCGDVVLVYEFGYGLIKEDENKYVQILDYLGTGYYDGPGYLVKPYDCELETQNPGENGYIGIESFGTNPMVILNVNDDLIKGTHIKIEVLTAEFNYQGLYKGTIIDNAKALPNGYGVELKHNGKNWILNEGDYLVFKDQENTKSESTSALDKQVSGSHYKNFKIQPAEYNHANNIPFLEGNVIKYVSRHRMKNKKKDLEKAIHCLELLIELEYKEED